MGKRISQEKKREILDKVESSQRVKDVAAKYGVQAPVVYSWLRKSADGTNVSLEMSRLKRQNKALLELVGRLTYEKELREKKGFNL